MTQSTPDLQGSLRIIEKFPISNPGSQQHLNLPSEIEKLTNNGLVLT